MKKIFFIHVGKTAGSTFNNFLAQNFTGKTHCERYLIPGSDFKLSEIDHLKNLDFVSGHLNLSVFFNNNFAKENYFLLAFLREPISHLISHLNWLMFIKEKGGKFFDAHPAHIKKISLELRESNLYDADTFIEKARKFSALLQNNQSKYFNLQKNQLSSQSILENMMLLDMVGITEHYKESLEKFIILNNLEINPVVETVNKNPSCRINKDILDNKTIHDFIREYQAVDIEIYNHFLNIKDDVLYEKNKTIFYENLAHKTQGRIDNINDNLVIGWARYLCKKEPVVLDIFINDIWLGETIAEKTRADLEKKFGCNCGFSFEIPETCALKSGDKIRVRVKHELQDISNSPFAFKNRNIEFKDTTQLFHLTHLHNIVKKSQHPLSGENLSYYEFLPKTTQTVKPSIWLGNQTQETFKELTSYVPAANLYEFHDVYLAGQGCIIDNQNRLLTSPGLQMGSLNLKAGGVNPVLINSSYPNQQKISFKKVLNIRKVEDVPCVPLSQPGEGIYDHWLIDILPRVVFAQQLGQKVKYILTRHLPDYGRNFLHLLGVHDEDIITYDPMTEVIGMKLCYFPGHLRQRNAFSALASQFSDRLTPYRSQCKNRKLFISRGNFNDKQSIGNVSALHELVKSYGIEIVEPHLYSIEEQIKLFSEAGFVMGEYGSSMHNTFFSYPETKVIVLQSNQQPHFVQAGIGALLNQPTGFIFGEATAENNSEERSFYVPLDFVKQAIETII